MATLYPVEDIAGFLIGERVAIHGVSPEVYEQNQSLVYELGRAASASSDALISVQIIGSRGNGTSALTSDVDLAVIAFEADSVQPDRERLANAARGLSISPEFSASINGIKEKIPLEAVTFISWVDNGAHNTASLFEEGIFATPDQRLGQLAVTSILRSYGTESFAASEWEEIRQQHTATYLGDMHRMREKLIERLGADQSDAIHRAISDELMQQRRVKFALPRDVYAYHNKLRRWANKNKASLQKRQGWRLYQDVLAEL